MTRTSIAAFAAAILLFIASAPAQQSDLQIQQAFEKRATELQKQIDAATTTSKLDSLKAQIDALAIEFQPQKEFLDKALYPSTFDERINDLRKIHQVAYGRTTTIQSQGEQILSLEASLALLSSRIDTLSGERQKLFEGLQAARQDVSSLRETIKRLSANLQANDKLMFALIDSLFLPYDKQPEQGGDIGKEAIAGKIQQMNILTRVYAVASDNVRFLHSTQLQPKDYTSLVDQYQQFRNRWSGLSGKMKDVAAAAARRAVSAGTKPAAGAKTGAPVPSPELNTDQVDSLLSVWNQMITQSFWAGLEKEFTSREIPVAHFTDGPSFSLAIRSLVQNYKNGGADPHAFVDIVWKERIDREWRDALSRDALLGKAEYASLDQTVSELNQKTIDFKLVLYIAAVVILGVGVWWLLSRQGKKRAAETPVPPPSEPPKAE